MNKDPQARVDAPDEGTRVEGIRDDEIRDDETVARSLVRPVGWAFALGLMFFLLASRMLFFTAVRPNQNSAERPTFRVDINRATATELQALPEIGPALAERIVQYRRQHGPFSSVHELQTVKGFGDKTLQQIESMLSVDSPSSEPTTHQLTTYTDYTD
ncbi:MAG: helix-hairpin-helix domain-containing protein [Pirellulaceae bacterium]